MRNMTLDEYQQKAGATAMYPGRSEIGGLTYVTLGLNGEAGEVAELTKKLIRDSGGLVSVGIQDKFIKEAGDVLWYLAQLCTELNVSLSVVAEINVLKLMNRQAQGTLGGSGSDR